MISRQIKYSRLERYVSSTYFYSIIYILAFLPLILNFNGIYWDDWTIWGKSFATVYDEFYLSGRPLLGLWTYFTATIFPLPLSRILIPVIFYVAGLFFKRLLIELNIFDRVEVGVLTLFFLLAPVNFARVALIVHNYSLSFACLWAGLWLFALTLKKSKHSWHGGLGVRICAHVALLMAYQTFSTIVFGLALPLIIVVLDRRINLRNLIYRSLQFVDFYIMPFVVWYGCSLISPKQASRAGYNEITSSSLIDAIKHIPIESFKTLASSLLPFGYLYKNGLFPVIICAGILLLIFILDYLIQNRQGIVREHPGFAKRPLLLGAIGYCAIALAIFPYLAVGKPPAPMDWDSRHQLLVGAGLALIYLAGFSLLATNWSRKIYLLFLVFLFASRHFVIQSWYVVDWYKQAVVISYLKEHKGELHEGFYILDDSALGGNALDRIYRFYEPNAWFAKAYGKAAMFVVPDARQDKSKYNRREFVQHEYQEHKSKQHKDQYNFDALPEVDIDRLQVLKIAPGAWTMYDVMDAIKVAMISTKLESRELDRAPFNVSLNSAESN